MNQLSGAKVSEKTSRRRIAIATASGTFIEFYDFQVYGIAAGLTFAHIFFPALGPGAGLVASIASFGVAFVFRPVGGILFGHIGDRYGRKRALSATLLLMGLGTVCIGLLPTADQIGITAPILLIFLRVLQGLAAGGEWAGAALLAGESVPKGKRGLYTMFPQLGGSSAIPLVMAVFLIVSAAMNNQTFMAWGWRVPFLLSAPILIIGFIVRSKVNETAVFEKQESEAQSGVPIKEAFRHQGREILLGAGAIVPNFLLTYVLIVFLADYATSKLDVGRTTVLLINLISGLFLVAASVISSLLSDRIGRRKLIGIANLGGVLWSLALFPVLGLDSITGIVVMGCAVGILAGTIYGPTGAFIPELFATRYRYSAATTAYALSTIVGGSIAPLVAPILVETFGGWSMGLFLAVLCVIAAFCTYKLQETRGVDLETVGKSEHSARTPSVAGHGLARSAHTER
ncbi:MFS transporter [Streptomyces sp. NPDC056983]|uniref:MFS transporter n=1 Tax=Streptomyces sp. NPDC056983 TaxID=3345987 RepID=UPI0036406802